MKKKVYEVICSCGHREVKSVSGNFLERHRQLAEARTCKCAACLYDERLKEVATYCKGVVMSDKEYIENYNECYSVKNEDDTRTVYVPDGYEHKCEYCKELHKNKLRIRTIACRVRNGFDKFKAMSYLHDFDKMDDYIGFMKDDIEKLDSVCAEYKATARKLEHINKFTQSGCDIDDMNMLRDSVHDVVERATFIRNYETSKIR